MNALRSLVERNRAGGRIGIASWCTAQADTLRAILRAHQGSDDPILIEATCNQVNQHGGYTGMTPKAFRLFVEGLAAEEGIASSRLILGGDHLGPNPWKSRPAAEAMAEARAMVRAYVEAGFTKIHLDASMACADDVALTEVLVAERAALLCAAAEKVGGDLCYVIGTEVPAPGGETQVLDSLAVTTPEAARRTYELHREKFSAEAFSRVIGIVVQPGVDFGNEQVFAFHKNKAARLSASIAEMPSVVFEAHSTDYQSGQHLVDLVSGHFAILKVGPELTFAFREAVVAMAAIEEWLKVSARSNILEVVSRVMDENPTQWRGYIPPTDDQEAMKLFGLSDRVRYYWPNPDIAAALRLLRANIDNGKIPPGLLLQYAGIVEGGPEPLSERIIQSKVSAVVRKYRGACANPAPVIPRRNF